jgi:ATPase subunit of ABC transporter with duplicated ATPase domains
MAYSNQQPLFDDVTASLLEHQRAALIGPNGAGKSTLLQIISGEREPLRGTVVNPWHTTRLVMEPEAGPLSWGEATWQALTAQLAARPALLLLDEPTRHLDRAHRLRLADWISRLDHTTMILVSHDLEFLDEVCHITWHLQAGRLAIAAMPPTAYLNQTQAAALAYTRRYRQQQEEIRRLEQDIRDTRQQAKSTETGTHDSAQRRYAKKVAKKAASREKRLQHRKTSGELLSAPEQAHVLRHTWDHIPKTQGTLLRWEDGSLGWDEALLRQVSLEVKAGDRIGIEGDNGSGKSSLLSALLGSFPGWTTGYQHRSPVAIGYVGQVFQADPTSTTWEYFRQRSTLSDGYGRAWLQSYGLADHHLTMPAASLSQGEQVKLQIAALSAQGVAILVLDEPEHYLDWPSLQSVVQGLKSYPGTLLVVSHQPLFLRQIGIKQRWVVSHGRVEVENADEGQ